MTIIISQMQKHRRLKFDNGLENNVFFRILRLNFQNGAPIWASQFFIQKWSIYTTCVLPLKYIYGLRAPQLYITRNTSFRHLSQLLLYNNYIFSQKLLLFSTNYIPYKAMDIDIIHVRNTNWSSLL